MSKAIKICGLDTWSKRVKNPKGRAKTFLGIRL